MNAKVPHHDKLSLNFTAVPTSKPSPLPSCVMLGLGLVASSLSQRSLLVSANRGHYRETMSWRKSKALSSFLLAIFIPISVAQPWFLIASSSIFISSLPELASVHSPQRCQHQAAAPICRSGHQLWGTPASTFRVSLTSQFFHLCSRLLFPLHAHLNLALPHSFHIRKPSK